MSVDPPKPITLLINGAKGRMGQAVAVAAQAMNLVVAAGVHRGDDLNSAMARCDVVLDFSLPAATQPLIEAAIANRKPIVVGTTGHSAAEKKALLALAGKVPCVWAENYSVGVNLLFVLTRQAAAMLDSDFDVELIETHHRFKKDAPSGTATRLSEIILEERKLTADGVRHGRRGITGQRTTGELGVHSLRGGDVIGDHTVIFAALGERLELTHKGSARGLFAQGAIRAAQWVVAQKPGVYDMQDVLGFR